MVENHPYEKGDRQNLDNYLPGQCCVLCQTPLRKLYKMFHNSHGENLETKILLLLSGKNTLCKNYYKLLFFAESIVEQRKERLLDEEKLKNAENVEKLKYHANVLGQNLSPSLSG